MVLQFCLTPWNLSLFFDSNKLVFLKASFPEKWASILAAFCRSYDEIVIWKVHGFFCPRKIEKANTCQAYVTGI